MASNSVNYIIQMRDRYSSTLNKLNRNLKKATSQMAKFGQKVRETVEKFKSIGQKLSMRVTAPLVALGAVALNSAAKIETMQTAFVGILGSAEKAKDMVALLNDFTAKTPFQLDSVSKSAKMLLAAGVGPKQIADNLQFIGDIASAANVPINEMAAIFSKLKNKGKAQAEELNQMAERGIPILQQLASTYNISKDAVLEAASKGQLSADIIEKALRKMASKGGFAYQAMILQSKTFSGVLSTLKDNFMLTMAEMGAVFLPEAKKIASTLILVAQRVKDWIKVNPKLAKSIFKIAAIMATLGPIAVGIGITIAALTSPFILVGAAITAVVATIIFKWGALMKFFEKSKQFIIDLKNAFVDAFKSIGAGIKLITSDIVFYFKQIWGAIDKIIEKIKPFIGMIKGLKNAFKFGRDKLSVGIKNVAGNLNSQNKNIGMYSIPSNLSNPSVQNINSKVDTSGLITVKAQKGSEIVNTQFNNPNLGVQMGY